MPPRLRDIIDSIIVHKTEKGAPYEISLYARISAIAGVDLFPAQRSMPEIVAEEGVSRIGNRRVRFITPTIIKTFYWLVMGLIVLFGISGIFSGLAMMAISPFGGFIMVLSSIASVIVGIIFARIAAELS